MEISIYTDAAQNPSTGCTGVGYLIHTPDYYVDMDSLAVETMSSIAAESMAVFKAMVNLIDKVNLTPEDTVTIYTDSIRVIRILKGIDKVAGKNRKVLYQTIDMYKKLSQKCYVELSWVQGHAIGYSQNTLVDRLAKYAIRCTQVAGQK